jgi:hypothetical protein
MVTPLPMIFAHAHDTLDVVITRDIDQYACNNWIMAGHKFIKFSMEVIPLETNPNSYYLISYSW